MNYPVELCRLVLRNMDIVETIPAVASSVEKRFFAAVNARIEERVKKQGRWKGCYDFGTDNSEEETYFAPCAWLEDENHDYVTYFSLGCTDDDGDMRKLSCATGLRGVTLYLGFEAINTAFGLRPKEYRQRLAVFFNETPALAQAGFYLSAGTRSIDRPFHFEVDKLADAYPDFDEILTPLDAALDDVFKVWEEFDTLVKQLLKAQGEKNGAI